MGDVVELHCEAQRGSPPILYWFYHKNVTLGNSSAPFGGGMSFNLTLTAEHSGNYSCGADNGLGVQRSEVVTLNITGLLSILGLAAATAALVGYFRTQRSSVTVPVSFRSLPGPGPPTQTPKIPNTLSHQPYKSHSQCTATEPTIIYSELKKAYPDDSTEQDSNRNIDEDATENYENVPCTSSAVDH
ncbi:hypothetical protein CB1_086314002 [Camelus ferus]|nr:hypothetical protein CB1_086314002 [Camelus ferus]